jgi:hypothetical protein
VTIPLGRQRICRGGRSSLAAVVSACWMVARLGSASRDAFLGQDRWLLHGSMGLEATAVGLGWQLE